MSPRVPLHWTSSSEVGSLFVRDTAFIRSQIHALRLAFPQKPSWTAYCEESSLIMAGLIHDKMYNPHNNPPITWAKWLPRFSSQVIRKPLVPGSDPIYVFPVKRSSTSEVSASASASKHAKLEALANVNAPNLTPTTSPAIVISFDDELTISAQEEAEPKKKKSAPSIVSIRPPKAIILLLAKSRASAKKGKGKGMYEQCNESSLDCYTTRYMTEQYTLPNGLTIQEGHL
ncbi:hypothetical protein LIER_42182 [Lithospermum erythrorhizon]|uniref:Uncharacterized protein n=1 Tax=Lithospermum erythrorhizon TaxID=34254 RepID=A0AAV3RNX8_LITER